MITEPTVVKYCSKPHPANPWLQIAEYDGTIWITGTHYEQESLGVFIPDGWIVPLPLIEDMELVGLLAGPEKNRVKRSKMKGIWSEGIFYGSEVDGKMSRHWNPDWKEGDKVQVEWRLIKWINPEYVEPIKKEG